MCIHSPWFTLPPSPAADGAIPLMPASRKEDPFSPHDDDTEQYTDIGTALSLCDGDNAIHHLASLRYFGVSATPLTSEGLKKLLGRLQSLRHLAIYLNYAKEFRTIGCLGELKHLARVTVHTCPSITSLHGIECSTSLTEINLTSCINLSSITSLVTLPTLRSLRINGCAAVAPSPFMEAILYSPPASSSSDEGETNRRALQRLSYLQLSELDNNCDNLSALRFLPLLTALDLHLTATDNNAVVVIAKNCVHLQALSLAECFVISEIEPLAALPYLSHLLLRNTTISDASLRRFCEGVPPSLRVLDISECDDITDCCCVTSIETLTRINAQGTRVTAESVYELVKDTVTMDNTPRTMGVSLETVDLRGCTQLKNISSLFAGRR
ncbi:putative adenylate cyclase regulatory protein [Bactrocera neohumeralis]|uniref:putative adenylate cyclase regulatory protein n=1 Tax=Bactrocera neohumeralis TaxID=98809 RepID=UPI0021655D83|nr:putative adenylate cyclase regulatory protein [Bactrocera neohumeralis]